MCLGLFKSTSKPLPKTIRERPVVLLFGQDGVGKTKVAEHICRNEYVSYSQQNLLTAMAVRILSRTWPVEMISSKNLIIEVPCFIEQRPQILSFCMVSFENFSFKRKVENGTKNDSSSLKCLPDIMLTNYLYLVPDWSVYSVFSVINPVVLRHL